MEFGGHVLRFGDPPRWPSTTTDTAPESAHDSMILRAEVENIDMSKAESKEEC